DHRPRGLRGRARGRRRPWRHARLRDAAAAAPHLAHRAPVPHARRAARVRPDVRAHGRRARLHHRDAAGVRLSQPLPDAAARLRRGRRLRHLRPRDARRLGVPARAARRGGDGVRRRVHAWDVMILVMLAAWAVPYFWQVRTSFTPDTELLASGSVLPSAPTLLHYRAVAEKSVMPRALGNSVGVASLTTLLALALGLPAAYALARLPIPAKNLLLLVVIASTAFPQITTVSPLYLLLRALGLRDTWTALVLANTSFALPLTIWLVTGFIREIPFALEESASVDGAGTMATIRWVIGPLLAPGLASAALLAFLFSWNEFLFAYTFTATAASRTVPVALALFPGVYEIPWGDIAAASMLASVPTVLIV